MQSYGTATPRIGKTAGKPKPTKAKPGKKRGR
jgi:hypothetical protein